MSASKKLIIYLLFLLSGAAGLIYQVVWVRVLQTAFGNTEVAVATVVAVYMGGLALGAWQGGRLADRFRRPILVYGLLELAVALYAVLVTPALYRMDFLYGLVGVNAGVVTLTLVRFLAAAVLLLIPTVAMGATLPVLTRALVRVEEAGEGVGLLYFVNTLGAVLGAATAGFVLVRFLGLSGSLYVGVVLGLTVLVGAAVLQRLVGVSQVRERPSPVAEAGAAPSQSMVAAGLDVVSPRMGAWLALGAAALCGYVSLVNEVAWTRVLGFLLDGTVYGFSALLTSFLLGIALGSLFIAPYVDSNRDLWGLFSKIQLGAALGSVLTVMAIPLVPSLVDAFLGGGTDVQGGFLIKVCLVFLVLLVPTIFFGAAFPVLVAIAARYRGHVASSLGNVYAANTVGSILGSISGGIVLLALVRDLSSILLGMVYLSALLALGAGLLSVRAGLRRGAGLSAADARRVLWWRSGLRMGAPALLLLVVAVARPNLHVYRLVCARYALEDYDRSLGFHAAKSRKAVDRIVWKAQGRMTVVTVHRLDDGGLRLRNNGLNEAYHGPTEPRYAQVIWYLGVLPYLLHPKPERALQIGLGGGGTAECLTYTNLKEITVVELEPEVVKASRWIYRTLLGPGKHPGDDPRVRIVTDDGRNALLRRARSRPHSYDLIVSQPSHAWLSGVASLYTEEQFRIVRRNLRRGGIFCQWINLFRMDDVALASLLRAFSQEFPSVTVWQVDSNSLLLVGGDETFSLDPAVVRRHLKETRVQKKASLFSVDEYAVFRGYLFGKKAAVALGQGVRANSDRHPVIEMRLPWVLHNNTVNIKRLLKKRGLSWGILPRDLKRGKGTRSFLRGMADDLITEYDGGRVPLARAWAFLRAAAPSLGVDGLVLKGRLARLEGDMATAVAAYEKAAAKGDAEARFQLGSLYLTLERYEDAAKECGRAYEAEHRADAHLCIAEARYHQGRIAEAAALVEAAFGRKEQEDLPLAHKWMGLIRYRQHRYAEARAALSAFVKLDATDAEAPYVLGVLRAMGGEERAARRDFSVAVANGQALASATSDEGKRYAALDHQWSAVARFRAAIRLQPDLGAVFQWMAPALRRWGRYDELEALLKVYAKVDATGAESLRTSVRQTAGLAERIGLVLHAYRSDMGRP